MKKFVSQPSFFLIKQRLRRLLGSMLGERYRGPLQLHMRRAQERRGEPEAEATYFAGHFPLFWETTATTLAGLSASASSPRSPSSFPQHRPKPNQTSGHPSGHSTAPRPQPPPERTERRGDEADVPYFGCRKVLWEASVVDRVNNNSQRPRVILSSF